MWTARVLRAVHIAEVNPEKVNPSVVMPGNKKVEALDLQGLPSGGDSWTRTNDPIDVNDVLCSGGKAYRKQMLGVHVQKNVDITGFPCFLLHPPGVRRMGVHRVFTPF